MISKRTSILAATAALAVGVGAGAAGYAAVTGGGGDAATTQQAVRTGTVAEATQNLSVGEIYKRTKAGVVEITVSSTSSASDSPFPFGDGSGSGQSQAQASGFVYDKNAHVVTNYHVVEGASLITVTFADGSKYKATVVGSDPSTDLAVLKVDAPESKLEPLMLGDSDAVSVGDGVVAIGSPFGLEETVTSGIVSALDRTISSKTSYSIAGTIQTDAAINPGNSGGPLLNLRGEVVGVNTQIESESGGNDGVGFAIPSNTVRSVVGQLIKGQTVKHPYLGVYVQTSSSGSGAQVTRVTSGSPAAAAGLKAGDVITALDGMEISNPDDLTGAISAKQPGDEVTVTYIRSSQTKTVTVTLGNRTS